VRNLKSLGFLVNPVAGMGGAVGLKGTDGKEILKKAISLGAKPISPTRAELFLSHIKYFNQIKKIKLIVGNGLMGEYEAQRANLPYTIVGKVKKHTTSKDTKEIAKIMLKEKVNLLAFCGGDGTARDILDVINTSIPSIGIPSGVKMYSAVFANNPFSAAQVSISFLMNNLQLKESEVLDIDEESFRQGRFSPKLYGYLLTPQEPQLVQNMKITSSTQEFEIQNQAAIALYIIEEILKPETFYILGPGTTTRTITDLINESKTLLGVDILYNKKIIAKNVNEQKIINIIHGKKSKIIVSPIGGQGFIFGRGNQQISSSVIRKVGIENIIILATNYKYKKLDKLRVDTNDMKLNKELLGPIKVITDYKTENIMNTE
jgi:predicted polyphosphate/ATP-dependent NAD kinase